MLEYDNFKVLWKKKQFNVSFAGLQLTFYSFTLSGMWY